MAKSDCKNCKENLLNKTKTIIGKTNCNDDCPEDTTCEDGNIASSCVYNSGTALPCTGINNGDSLTTALTKIDSKLGVKVTTNDACCGFLFDKIVSDTLTKTVVVESGCQKLKLEVDDNTCDELDWLDLSLEEPFVSGPDLNYEDLSSPSGLVFDFGETQDIQYALDPCNGKVYFRGVFMCPSGESLTSPFAQLATLPPGARPEKVRMMPIALIPVSTNILWVTIVIVPTGEMFLSTTAINIAANDIPVWVSMDGFSIEV